MSFLNLILYSIVGHEMYSFMENYNGYNQVKMVEEDKVKPTFILEWGAYAYNVLSFGLCNVATPLWPRVGVKPNTWKSWRFGVLRDSRMFRAR
jgi:hypothetical protein